MSPIYTGAGDGGTTSLASGGRVGKDDPRVEAYGSVDECCSLLGVARSLAEDEVLREVVAFSQARLYAYAGMLASAPDASETSVDPAIAALTDRDIGFLERAIDHFEEATGPLDHFLVPGGSPLAAQLYYARAVTRRAERRVIAIPDPGPRDGEAARFLNRLSDLLFAAGRYANKDAGRPDRPWEADAEPPRI
jgi:cob(I)alamin adenosyltransferase